MTVITAEDRRGIGEVFEASLDPKTRSMPGHFYVQSGPWHADDLADSVNYAAYARTSQPGTLAWYMRRSDFAWLRASFPV